MTPSLKRPPSSSSVSLSFAWMIVTTVALCTYDRSAHTVRGRPPRPAAHSGGRARWGAPVTPRRSWSSHHHQKTTLTENVIGGCKSRGHRGHWQAGKKTRVARISS